MMDLASRDLAVMGATLERIPGRIGYGDCVRATLRHRRAGEPGLLLMGHMDTVHPVGTMAGLPWRRDGNRAYGPGIYDMRAVICWCSRRYDGCNGLGSRGRCR